MLSLFHPKNINIYENTFNNINTVPIFDILDACLENVINLYIYIPFTPPIIIHRLSQLILQHPHLKRLHIKIMNNARNTTQFYYDYIDVYEELASTLINETFEDVSIVLPLISHSTTVSIAKSILQLKNLQQYIISCDIILHNSLDILPYIYHHRKLLSLNLSSNQEQKKSATKYHPTTYIRKK